MSACPELMLQVIGDEMRWMIDWRNFFKRGVKVWDPRMSGEMRGFHVVFKLRINKPGLMVFWDDDGSIIRRDGEIVHQDRSAHALKRSEIQVREGDILEIAQWQFGWDWLWGARIDSVSETTTQPSVAMQAYLAMVQSRLHEQAGPPLKMYTDGKNPLRAVVAIYSLILNGYVPSDIFLFGEEQWDARSRALFQSLLPFAHIVEKKQVDARLFTFGGKSLVDLAHRYWFVMKTFVSLLCPPESCCMMDDDVFILDRLDDALSAFSHNDLVFTPDQELGAGYLSSWRHMNGSVGRLRTGRFNAGLYWVRRVHDERWLATQALRGRPNPNAPFLWEQGFIAVAYAHQKTLELPNQRYLFPLFDGLPGGVMAYDYARNPCGFASIHFGGLAEKPSDGVALQIAPYLFGDHVSHLFTNRAKMVLE